MGLLREVEGTSRSKIVKGSSVISLAITGESSLVREKACTGITGNDYTIEH